MKRIKSLLMSLTLAFTLSGCSSGNYTIVQKSDVIVDKKSERNIRLIPLFNGKATTLVPITKTNYYFTLKEYGERQVDKKTYETYKINDTYTWEEKVYA